MGRSGILFGCALAAFGASCGRAAPGGTTAPDGSAAPAPAAPGCSRAERPLVVRPRVVGLALGSRHTCALDAGGQVWCWGHNRPDEQGGGELGDGALEDRGVPAVVPGLSGVVQIAAQESSTCALLRDGTVTCWGFGHGLISGRKGPDQPANFLARPTPVPDLGGVIAIVVGRDLGHARLTDGTVRTWQRDGNGGFSAQPAIKWLRDVQQIAAGQTDACARLGDLGNRTVWCWKMQWSTNGWVLPRRPTQVLGLRAAIDLAVCLHRACATLENGSVKCWETPSGFELTDAPGEGMASIALSYHLALMRRRDGSVTWWGAAPGPLIGTMGLSPATAGTSGPVPGLHGVVEIGIGVDNVLRDHACARLDDGLVKCWGSNEHGQLGDGTTELHRVPADVVW